jgi:DNA-directed RNA polymerase beta' subunit
MSDNIPYAEISSIQLYVLGSEDNKRDSNVSVIHQDLFRNGLPYPGGPYDGHGGTTSHKWDCESCLYDKKSCPGHPGSYELHIPVPSPMFMKDIIKWLKVTCFNCGKPVVRTVDLRVPKDKILGEYVKITRTANKNIKCCHCEAIHPHIVKEQTDPVSIYMEVYETRSISSQSTGSKYKLAGRAPLYPHQILTIFNKIENDTVIKMGKPILCHPKKLLINVLRVPPNTIRPDVEKINAGRSNSNDLTILLQTIMKINDQIPNTIPDQIDSDLHVQIHNLCLAVFDLIKGSNTTAKRGIVSASKKPLTSIAKRWPRKYGRIRRNLMGRRANHMGRSFITGDPFRKITEVGVPISIAKNIQHPIVVREYNYQKMMVYFMNGNKRYPGCTRVKKKSTGATHWLGRIKDDFKLEIGDTIFRDTIDGDIVGFNRQPSLEPSSISSMECVIMESGGDTIRLNVLACSLFNADFDGDAMNLVFSRSSRTRNEIRNLSSPAQFFISYKDGKPKIGEAQDSVVGLAELTSSKTKINKYHAMQMFNQVNIYHDFSQYPPDYIFTGREIVSIYLKESGNHINLTATPSYYNPDHAPYRKYDPRDIKVEIDRGVLKSGILDKATIGEGSNGSIFHVIHNQYSPHAALDASFYMQQIAISYLFNKGFTMTLRDLLLKDDALEEIHKIESSLIAESHQITENLNQGKIIAPIGKTLGEYYEEQQINSLKPGDAFWEHVLGSIDAENNNMFKAIMYGARGKTFNFINTVCAIGQIEINGERMKENFGGRSLPYFTKYDPDPRARGYINNSYILGINPTEFWFHAGDSRYQLINKALSTSITGTQNRMAIKNLEATLVDNQRKAVSGSQIIQLLYGANGSDPRFIEKVKFHTMRRELTWDMFDKEFRAKPELFDSKISDPKSLDEEYEQLVEDRKFFTNLFLRMEMVNSRPYTDTVPMPVNPHRIIEDTLYNLELKTQDNTKEKSSLDPITALEKVKELCNDVQYCLINEIQRKRGTPIPLYLRESCKLLKILIRSYLNLSTLVRRRVNNEALDIIIEQIKMFYSKSLIDYGKAIGIIASQSISEPMTQMVLDSHHYSGAGSTKKKGMFRIKEILSARPTKKMKAPSMTLQVMSEYRKNKIKVQEIANHIEMLPLKQFVDGWQIFFEKYGEPIHPLYVEEKEFIREFEKYHLHIKPPSDLTNWCIRLVLDKSKLIEKQMKIDTIYHKIRQSYPAMHIVYSTDNAETIIMRIYLRNSFVKKGSLTVLQATSIVEDLMELVVRGIEGINAAYVKDGSINKVQEDGSIIGEKVYYIFTDGTNLKKILENPFIDPDTAQSDSIVETYEVWGITATREKIINELRHQVDGSAYGHYAIYADTMTHSGYVTSIDRYGSAKRDSSILLRISDASPISVIEESAINAFSDDLSGISPPIMIGKNPIAGDLYNTFKTDEEMIAERIRNLDDIIGEL